MEPMQQDATLAERILGSHVANASHLRRLYRAPRLITWKRMIGVGLLLLIVALSWRPW